MTVAHVVATVAPRYVAAPWELEQRTGRRTRVGLEDHVSPEPGPVELYRSVWPDRYVSWNRDRQRFELLSERDPGYSEDVFFWDAEPGRDVDGNPVEFSPEEIAEMVDSGDGRAVKRFLPFDYALVNRRIQEAWEFNALGANRSRKLLRRIGDHNAGVARRHRRAQDEMWEDWSKEDHRYLPELAALHAGATPAEAKVERIPLVAPGINLTAT